jgi:hypothetical protein
MKIGNLVRIVRRQGWRAENDPGVGIVTEIREQYPLLDEYKVSWGGAKPTWENSGLIACISEI